MDNVKKPIGINPMGFLILLLLRCAAIAVVVIRVFYVLIVTLILVMRPYLNGFRTNYTHFIPIIVGFSGKNVRTCMCGKG